MTDPIRHEVISFLTKNEADQFELGLKATFGEYAFSEITIELTDNRHVLCVFSKRLYLPKRVVAFAIGWASATTYREEKTEAMVLASTEYNSLDLYR